MLPAHQAEALILDLTHPFNPQQDMEMLDLLSATGRILAQPVSSQLDFPTGTIPLWMAMPFAM